jgi:hypothetical protein
MDDEQFSLVWPRVRKCAADTIEGSAQTEIIRMMGYTGWKCGSVFLGRSDQGAMLQASGISAQAVCELGLWPDNVSRIDLQATVWLDVYSPDVAREVAEGALRAFSGRRGRKPAIRHINGYGRGDTAYIGTRGKKAVMIRVYDKQKESGNSAYDKAWRYEAELTDQYAMDCYATCIEAGFGEQMIAKMLMGYLKLRGVEIELGDVGRGFDLKSLPKQESTNERRIKWLAEQVAPTVERLQLDGVDLSVILDALRIGR